VTGKVNDIEMDIKKEIRKRIGMEEHWLSRELEEKLPKAGFLSAINPADIPSIAFARLRDIEEFRLSCMDENNITMQVPSHIAPGIQGFRDAATAITMAKKVNDTQAEIIGRHPGRFGGLASVPTQEPKAAAEELERAITQLGLNGAVINGHTNGEFLDEKKFWVIWERAEALGVPIYLQSDG